MTGPKTIESPVGAEIVLDGRRFINFGGSSYLGLSYNPEVIAAGVAPLLGCGAGYQFSRHYGIATRAHQEVEAEAAAFFGSEAAMYLAGGYFYGLVAIGAIHSQFDTIFFDEFSHHSMQQGIAASGLKNHAFHHLDAQDLEQTIKQHLPPRGKPLVITDGLYSTLGEIAPLDELTRVIQPYGGRLAVDESHSFGVLGRSGRGAREHHNLEFSSVMIGGSTSKAFGVMGGIIPVSREQLPALRATPTGRGAAAGLPAAAAMCAASVRYVRAHPELLQRLRVNVAYLKSGLRTLGLTVLDNDAPVASFVSGSKQSMNHLQERLMREGIFVLHSNYIAAGNRGVIRCGIFADHTSEQFDHFLEALRRLL